MNRWERRTEWPLTGLAVVFLGAYAWPILDPGLDEHLVTACAALVWLTWLAFVLDYVARLALAERRVAWFVQHLLDLVIIALPLLRPLRLLRLVTLIRVLNRTAITGFRGRVGLFLTAGTTLLAVVSALAVLDAERGAPDATIANFGDALWWACTTMTTVGYGDLFPVTGTGRAVGVGLMVAGIALLGSVTATLASWMVERVSVETSEIVDRSEARHEFALQDELAALRGELTELRQQLAARPGPSS